MADEVVEGDVENGAGAAVGFEHEHLVAGGGVDVVVLDVGDVCGRAGMLVKTRREEQE